MRKLLRAARISFASYGNACYAGYDPGSVFKDYDFHGVQSLEEKLKDLDSLSLNYWLEKFVQQVAIAENGCRYPPRSLKGLKRHLEDVNEGNALKQCARNV